MKKELAKRIDKLNDELDKAIGILLVVPFSYATVREARVKIADVSAELSKLADELNEEDK